MPNDLQGIAGAETIVYTSAMGPTGIHQDRQLVIKAFLDRMLEMKPVEQVDLISSFGGLYASIKKGDTEETEDWVKTISELFVDPPFEIIELDLTEPGNNDRNLPSKVSLDEAIQRHVRKSAEMTARIPLSMRTILSLSEAKALAKDPEFARSMEEAAKDLQEGKGTVLPAGTFPSTDGKSVDGRGQ